VKRDISNAKFYSYLSNQDNERDVLFFVRDLQMNVLERVQMCESHAKCVRLESPVNISTVDSHCEKTQRLSLGIVTEKTG